MQTFKCIEFQFPIPSREIVMFLFRHDKNLSNLFKLVFAGNKIEMIII